MLKLETERRSLSYDALTAQVAIVFTRYMILSVEKRMNEDERTTGELFYIMCDELKDITFGHSMSLLVQALLDSVTEIFRLTQEQLQTLLDNFCYRLPYYLRNLLTISCG